MRQNYLGVGIKTKVMSFNPTNFVGDNALEQDTSDSDDSGTDSGGAFQAYTDDSDDDSGSGSNDGGSVETTVTEQAQEDDRPVYAGRGQSTIDRSDDTDGDDSDGVDTTVTEEARDTDRPVYAGRGGTETDQTTEAQEDFASTDTTQETQPEQDLTDTGADLRGVEEAGAFQFQDQAQQFEQEIIANNPNLTDPSQIQIDFNRDENQFAAALTEQGRTIRRRQIRETRQEARSQRQSITGGIGGTTPLGRRLRARRQRQQVTGGIGGQTQLGQAIETQTEAQQQRQQITGGTGGQTPTGEAIQSIEEQFEEQVGRDVTRDEFEVDITVEGITATPTGEELQADLQAAQAPSRTEGDIFSPVVSGVESGLSEVAQVASGDEDTRVEFRGEGSVVNVARQESIQGTPDLTADLGPISDLGDQFTAAGQQIQRNIIAPTAEVAGPVIGLGADTIANLGRVDPQLAQRTLLEGFEAGAEATGQEDVATQFRQEGEDLQAASERVDVASEFGEGTASGGLSILNIPAIAGTGVTGLEVGTRAVQRTAAGEGGEFAEQAGGQAALIGAQVTEQAAAQPTRFTGQIVGGLASSSAILRGAQTVGGPRTARVASFGIQPGEELAITAARRGIPGTSRVAQTFGDVPVSRGEVEAETTDNILGSPFSRARERATEIRQRAPRARVSTDPETGRFSLSDPLQRDIALRLGTTERAIGEIPGRVREGALRSAVRARNVPQDVRFAVGREATIRGGNIDTALVEGAVRARNLRADAPDIADETLRSGLVRAQNIRQDIGIAGRQRALGAATDIDRTVLGSLVRAQNIRADAPEAISGTAAETAVRAQNLRQDLEIAASQRATGLAISAERGALGRAVRAQNFFEDGPSFGERIGETTAETIFGARNLRQDIGIEGRRAIGTRAFNLEQRGLEGAVRARNLIADAPDAISGTATETAIRAQNLRQDLGIAARQQATGVATDVDRSVLSGLVRAQNLRQDAPDIARRGAVRAVNLREDLSDVGIELQPGRPPRRGFALDTEDIQIETDETTSVFGFESEGGAFESNFEFESDRPQQAVAVAETETETDATPETRTETGPLARTFQQTETAVGTDTTEPTLDPVSAQFEGTGLDVGPETRVDVGSEIFQPIDERIRTEPRTEPRTEARQEPRTEPRTETRAEPRTELRTELRQELRQEPRTEFRFEPRTETRIETDIPLEPDEQDARFGDGGFGTQTGGVFTSFINPLTGETIQTEANPQNEPIGLNF